LSQEFLRFKQEHNVPLSAFEYNRTDIAESEVHRDKQSTLRDPEAIKLE